MTQSWSACSQAWRSEFHSKNRHGRRRESIDSCKLSPDTFAPYFHRLASLQMCPNSLEVPSEIYDRPLFHLEAELNGILCESRCIHKLKHTKVPFNGYWPLDDYEAGEPLSWVVWDHWWTAHVPIENSTPISWLDSVCHKTKDRVVWGRLFGGNLGGRWEGVKRDVTGMIRLLYECMTLSKNKLISKKKLSFINSKTNFSLHVFSFKEIEWLGELLLIH